MEERPRSDDRRSTQELFRDLWSQALFAVGAAEDEARRILERFAGAVDLKPEELERYRRELTERLRSERRGLERLVEEGLSRAIDRLRLPTRDEIAALAARIDEVAARIDRLAAGERPREETK